MKLRGNNREFDKKYLDKYYQGKYTLEEKLSVQQWLADHKYNKETTEAAKQEWGKTSLEGNQKELLTNTLFEIHYNLHLDECRKINETRWLFRANSIYTYISAAAIVLLVVLNIWLWQGESSITFKEPVFTEIYAPGGSRIKFNLPDGSSGWLNSGSSLKFPVKFANNERKVFLSGEGYFNVKGDPKKSFVVSTKYYQIRALGTSFNVQAYHDVDSLEEVTLESGMVQIEKKRPDGTFNKILDMKPGQHAEMDYFSNLTKVIDNEADKYTAWKDGKLIFRNDPLERLIKDLQRYYNIQISVEDEHLFDYHFHATFDEETLFETMRLLKLSSAIDYKICKRKKNEEGNYEKQKIILLSKK